MASASFLPSRVRCHRCNYHYPRDRMRHLIPSGRYECLDGPRCRGRVVSRERLDGWKRGQR